jgi:hypothetical protein
MSTQDEKKATQTHYEVEDVPNMDDADTVLDMWRESRNASPTLAQAGELVDAIRQQLSHMHQWASETKKPRMAKDIQNTWARVEHLHHQLMTHNNVADAAGKTLDVVDKHRQGVMAELGSIMRALRDEGEHPAVSDFSDLVVEEEFEGLYENASIEAENDIRITMKDTFTQVFIEAGMVRVDAVTAAEELMRLGFGHRVSGYYHDVLLVFGEALVKARDAAERGDYLGYKLTDGDEGVA